MLIVAPGVTGDNGVLIDCTALVVDRDSALLDVSVLTIGSVVIGSEVAGDFVLTELSVVSGDSGLL